MTIEKTYLGDSVYAEIDSWGAMKLTTNNGLPDDPRNVIVFDLMTYKALARFMQKIDLACAAAKP